MFTDLHKYICAMLRSGDENASPDLFMLYLIKNDKKVLSYYYNVYFSLVPTLNVQNIKQSCALKRIKMSHNDIFVFAGGVLKIQGESAVQDSRASLEKPERHFFCSGINF